MKAYQHYYQWVYGTYRAFIILFISVDLLGSASSIALSVSTCLIRHIDFLTWISIICHKYVKENSMHQQYSNSSVSQGFTCRIFNCLLMKYTVNQEKKSKSNLFTSLKRIKKLNSNEFDCLPKNSKKNILLWLLEFAFTTLSKSKRWYTCNSVVASC